MAGTTTQPDEPAARERSLVRVACACAFAPQAASGWSLPLGTEPLVLGRDPELASGWLAGDSQLSRRHAELSWSDDGERRGWLLDLDSRNGTYLNGRRVTRAAVKLHDVVRIGNTVLQIVEQTDELAVVIEPPFIGRSPALRATLARVRGIARSPAPVLITGETGTGKELLAEAVHRLSERTGPLIAVNCAAIPRELVESELFGHERGAYSGAAAARPGLFRAAERGTLFLDEVGELAQEIQAKLLRALDGRAIRPVGAHTETAIDVRVVAATNRDLLSEVAEHRFRADLYARLAELVLAIDPLRRRVADLEPLWRHFATQLGGGRARELSGAAAEALALHDWPFNVRELRQVVRGVLDRVPDDRVVALDDLPELRRRRNAPVGGEPDDDDAVAGEVPTPSQLRRLVEQYQGNIREVAAFLGKDRKQVYRWLKRYDIEPKAYRDD